METKTTTKASEFLKERFKYFEDNVFPKTNAIMDAMLNTERLVKAISADYDKYVFKCNGVKFVFDYSVIFHNHGKTSMKSYELKIRHKFRLVLHYHHFIDGNTTLYRFHECGWIQKLKGAVEMIQACDLALVERDFEKRCEKYKKRC